MGMKTENSFLGVFSFPKTEFDDVLIITFNYVGPGAV